MAHAVNNFKFSRELKNSKSYNVLGIQKEKNSVNQKTEHPLAINKNYVKNVITENNFTVDVVQVLIHFLASGKILLA